MGYMVHHAIIVTSSDQKLINAAYDKAIDLFCTSDDWITTNITPIVMSRTNSYHTFLIPPDGSKEGWETSNVADENRRKFVEWLDAKRYNDNSTRIHWAEIQYGDEERDNRLIRHSGERPYGEEDDDDNDDTFPNEGGWS